MNTQHENTINTQKVYLSILLLICLIALGVITSRATTAQQQPQEVQEVQSFEAFNDLDLEADSVYVWDVKNRQMLYGRNIEEQRPLASLSKIMTALVATENLKEGSVRITGDDLIPEGDSGLEVGERWRISDLIDFTLLVSSNDGARAIAGAVGGLQDMSFVERMNQRAQELGLQNMYFNNPSGLDAHDLSNSGGYGSVRDIVHLFDYILRTNPSLLEATAKDALNFNSDIKMHQGENTNKIINDIPFVIASKTGYTDLAGGNLVVAVDVAPNHPVILGVLGSTPQGRFWDIEKLYRATIQHIKK
ncbi:MAG: serine hydrolase [Candidatus Paceibacterota bacterium]